MIEKSRFSREAARWFKAGENVVANARQFVGNGISAQDAIEVAYDLQAGSYVEIVSRPENEQERVAWGKQLAAVLGVLGVRSVCEAGVGEATTLAHVATAAGDGIAFSGFDISVSRMLFGREYARSQGAAVELFCADLLHIPLPDSSIDAVVTNHSIEPNGGQEEPILRELFRVCARYLVLIEPDFEFGSPEQKDRMARLNYVRDLPRHLQTLPGRIVRREPWPLHPNPLNKASLIVVEKHKGAPPPQTFEFVSPITKSSLTPLPSFLFCAEEGLLYPVPFGIPVLRDDCAIVCSHAGRFGAGV